MKRRNDDDDEEEVRRRGRNRKGSKRKDEDVRKDVQGERKKYSDMIVMENLIVQRSI